MLATARAQDGAQDPTFDAMGGANYEVVTIAVQPDGKILAGGIFSDFNGSGIDVFVRLGPDGTLDATFDQGTGANGWVTACAIQPDGKILVGGDFSTFDGVTHQHIVRLNTDGSVDPSFTGAVYNIVEEILIQPDGKIVLVGFFSSGYITRLNADGTVDPSFTIGSGANDFVRCAALQPDGKILIGGIFWTYNGIPRSGVARLNSDGTLDTGFDPGSGTTAQLTALALQSDGKIVVSGIFVHSDGTPTQGIARLNTDGSYDNTFGIGLGLTYGINDVAIQPDDRIVTGGTFTSFDGTVRDRIARLEPDGALDASFDPGVGADDGIDVITLQPDGLILIGGNFTSYAGVTRNRIARLLNDYTTAIPASIIEESFLFPNPTNGVFSFTSPITGQAEVMVADPAGRVVMKERVQLSADQMHSVDLGELSPGTYVVSVQGWERTLRSRVVKH